MRTTNRLLATVAVVRSYNNSHIAKCVGQLLSYGLGMIIIVINGALDKGSTKGYLGGMLQDNRVKLLEMADGYSWSNAINLAITSIAIHNTAVKSRGEDGFRFVFNVSVEALFTKKQFEEMLDEISDHTDVGVVGTSFRGLQNRRDVSLGRSYRHPRNTGMLIRIEMFGGMFGFDARCDAFGGMEDIAFVLAMLVMTSFKYKMLDLGVNLVVGVNYHQLTKEQREQAAMKKIIAFWRSLFNEGSVERQRIESAVAFMRLEN